QLLELVAIADLWIERVVVDDVVAVLAARPGAQERRAVQMAETERSQIRHDRARGGEAECAMQLHTVGGARNPRATGARRIDDGSRALLRERARQRDQSLVFGEGTL